MKSIHESNRTGHLRSALSVALGCALVAAATLAQAGKVTPPPLPPGSAQVKVEPGMNKEEQNREDRAHHHKGQNKKDITKDDSLPGNNGNGKGNNK